ncbi:Os02g0697450, partial [Oryza sativa Japonica Group]
DTDLSEDGLRQAGAEGVLELLAERGGAGEHDADGAEVVALHERVLGEREHERRHDGRHRHAPPLDGPQHGAHLEPGHQRHRRAGAHRAQQHGVEREDVEQRQHAQRHVAGTHVQVRVLAVHLLRHARHDAPVRQHHALGQARRARRERQRHGVVRRDGHLRDGPLVGVRDQVPERQAAFRRRLVVVDGDHGERVVADGAGVDPWERLVLPELVDVDGLGEDELHAGGLELLVDLLRRAERVGGGGDRAEERRGEERHGELHAVLEQHHDAVAVADAQPVQRRGGPAAQQARLGERVRPPRGRRDEARRVGELGRPGEAVLVQGQVAGDVDVRKLGPEHRHRLRRRL